MLREAIAFDRKTGKPNFSEMTAQEKWYANVGLPCEIIWGKCDQTVPVYVGYMLEHQLPNARLSVIPNCTLLNWNARASAPGLSVTPIAESPPRLLHDKAWRLQCCSARHLMYLEALRRQMAACSLDGPRA
jgi:hypothetical protein